MLFVYRSLLVVSFSLLLGAGFSAYADEPKLAERPQVLADFASKWGKPIDAFFAERDANASLDACRTKLTQVRKLYAEARKAKNYGRMEAVLIGKTALPGAEPSSLIQLLNKCGPCVSRVKHEEPSTVYSSDGWCRSSNPDKAKLGASVDRGKKFLTNLNSMQKKNGGFNYIMEFLGVNPTSGEHLAPAAVTAVKSPFLAFIAVKGFSLAAFSYLGEVNYLDRTPENDTRNFMMEFKAVAGPGDFEEPEVYDHPKGALSFPLFVQRLTTVDGRWFVDGDGNRHYQTSADFGEFDVVDFKPLAEQIMMDTVYNMHEMLEAE